MLEEIPRKFNFLQIYYGTLNDSFFISAIGN